MIRIQTDADNNPSKTILNSTVENAWLKKYKIGLGVNALTGELAKQAIEPPTLKPSKALAPEFSYTLITSKQDLEDEINTSVGGNYNLDGVDFSASSSYMKDVTVSDLSMTLLAQMSVEESEFSTADSYKLAVPVPPQAGAFRESYGDYFIAGVRSGSYLSVVYQCRFSSRSEREEFSAKLGAGVPLVFSVEGATEFKKTLSEFNGKVSVKYSAEGAKNQPEPPVGGWTPETIPELFKWFKDNTEMKPIEALLYHYRMIDPALSAEINVVPEVFTLLKFLQVKYREALVLFTNCPSFGLRQVKDQMIMLMGEMESAQRALPSDPQLIGTLTAKTQQVLAVFEQINNRQAFYSQVLMAISSEPKADELIDADKGVVRWGYGFNQSTLPGVNITSETVDRSESSGSGWQKFVFRYQNSSRIIVGWDVICNWTDGTGGDWKKVSQQILGRASGDVFVKSDWWRGFSWTVRWHTVDAADYPTGPWAANGIHGDEFQVFTNAASDGDDYWTPERMISATPEPFYDVPPYVLPEGEWIVSGGIGSEFLLNDASGLKDPSVWALEKVNDASDAAHRSIGKLFYTKNGANMVASAVVVGRSLILTAGHCIYSGKGQADNIYFVPAYAADKANPQPFGKWKIKDCFMAEPWVRNYDYPYDLAICVVHPGPIDAKPVARIGDVVGNKGMAGNQQPAFWADIGYPGEANIHGHPFNGREMWACFGDRTVSPEAGTVTMHNVFTAGASGSPWFADGAIANVGGLLSTGTDNVGYSPEFAYWVKELYDLASANSLDLTSEPS
ncbi:serine protease [Pseudomonas sp. GV071]|uniref:trypsin-like serine peptidase n=1 Tax=Pseudomonas sp. GV071 TaxID=2135754 RepID=UPI000D39025F|nr:hypothetical protein [Pseudomonas sp. GV071]PTQ74160.1 hypothetical protein C8K61_101600 [Pseudomonas sp. GV071]